MLLEYLNVRDDFSTVGVGVDLTVDLGDVTRRVDDEGIASCHMDKQKRPIGIVTFGDRAALVRQEGKR